MKYLSTGIIHRLCATPNSALNLAMYLRYSVRSMLVGEPLWRIARKRCLVLLAMLFVVGTTPAYATKAATTSIDSLKLYAHSRIVNEIQYHCFRDLIHAESRWNLNAINPNGKHFGLGQMNNAKYRNLDGYRMIDWSIKYNLGRYGSHCNAYRFFKKNGYH
jgi:hypothetical protein